MVLGADGTLCAYVENIIVALYAPGDPSGPVHHNLPIGYLELFTGLDGDQNGNSFCSETTYCLC